MKRIFFKLLMIGLFCQQVYALPDYETWKQRQLQHDQRLMAGQSARTLQQRVVQVAPQMLLSPQSSAITPTLGEQIQVNINTADAEELQAKLAGVGRKKAQAIVAYRQKNGQFQKPEDLMNVKGIGEKLFSQNKDRITVR